VEAGDCAQTCPALLIRYRHYGRVPPPDLMYISISAWNTKRRLSRESYVAHRCEPMLITTSASWLLASLLSSRSSCLICPLSLYLLLLHWGTLGTTNWGVELALYWAGKLLANATDVDEFRGRTGERGKLAHPLECSQGVFMAPPGAFIVFFHDL